MPAFFRPRCFRKNHLQIRPGEIRIPEGQAGIRIGVAHGSLCIEGKFSEDDFPIDLKAHERIGLDYLALGHWHGHFVHDEKVVYSGTHETCNFGEKNSGQAYCRDNGTGRVTADFRVRTGQLNWLTEELDFDLVIKYCATSSSQPNRLSRQSGKTLLRIRTRGHSGADAGVLLQSFEDETSPRLLHLAIERRDTPTVLVQGKLAEMASNYPIVGGLISGIASRGLPADESGAAMQLLFEILASEAR